MEKFGKRKKDGKIEWTRQLRKYEGEKGKYVRQKKVNV
jgi:hypothetical protein